MHPDASPRTVETLCARSFAPGRLRQGGRKRTVRSPVDSYPLQANAMDTTREPKTRRAPKPSVHVNEIYAHDVGQEREKEERIDGL